MSEFRADLHCHSYCSDGEDSPFELLAKAKAANLQGLSITDHDSMEAYSPLLFDDAKRLGIHLLPGIELSSEYEGSSVHVLGYGFDLNSPSLGMFLVYLKERRRDRNLAIFEKMRQHRMPITEEELIAFLQTHTKDPNVHRTIGRPHIAYFMLHKGYVSSTQQAFEMYLKEGGLCYASGIKVLPKEAIEQIHRANGKAVLAHPHFIKKGERLRQILSLPFDGIECHYAALPKELELPWLDIANQKKWIATGGSDYHGSFKPHIPLGASWSGESVFKALQSTIDSAPAHGESSGGGERAIGLSKESSPIREAPPFRSRPQDVPDNT